MTTNSKRRFLIISQSLFLMIAFWLISCFDNTVAPNGGNTDQEGVIGKIVMHKTGGFAGVSQIITIEEKDDSILLTSVDERTNHRSESTISSKELDELWQTLEANDVFTLPTNQEMLANIVDAFGYEISVQRGDKQNQFYVYAPVQLIESGEKRYDAIVQAIEQFADLQLKDAEEFIIADLPVNKISVEILESYPYQIHIVVDGYLSDGCTTLDEITQQRDGNTINVHITTKRPKDAFCIQAITEIQERIPLDGGFLTGHYKVIVNDVEKKFEL